MGVLKSLRFLALGAVAAALPMSAHAICPGPCIRDAEIEKILREYSDPIFTAAGLTASEVNIYLMNDPSLNAGAFGGHNMAINSGLIMAADSPEMLKGVIAHEAGHIALRHTITRSEAYASSMGGAQLISIGLGVLAMAAGRPDAGMALIASGQTFGMLTFFKYTRIEESAADQAGIGYMAATGQSPEGLVAFMEKFRYEELMSEAGQKPYFRSHPVSSERISLLRRRASEIAVDTHPQSQKTLDQFTMMKAKLIGYIGPPSRVNSRYPATDTSEPARYARAIAAYRAVDIKKALTEINALIETSPTNPYYQELLGQVLFENSRIEESIAPNRKSVELAPNEPLLMVNLARSLIETDKPENLKEAEDLLIVAISREEDNAFAWNQIARVYAKQGRPGDADLATAEEAYSIGDMSRAQVFAHRAVGKLAADTPNGRRARDITNVSDPRAMRIRGGRPG